MYLLKVCLALGFILAVKCQDPTSICYPTTFKSSYFDMITEDEGVLAYDFNVEMFAQVSDKTGARVVHDFKNLMAYVIAGEAENNTECKSSTIRQSRIMHQCLPPYAKLVPASTGIVGYLQITNAALAIQLQTWDVETEHDSVHRIIFRVYSSASYPPWPVMSQEYGYHGTTHLYTFVNSTTSISDRSIFKLPPECRTHDVISLPILG